MLVLFSSPQLGTQTHHLHVVYCIYNHVVRRVNAWLDGQARVHGKKELGSCDAVEHRRSHRISISPGGLRRVREDGRLLLCDIACHEPIAIPSKRLLIEFFFFSYPLLCRLVSSSSSAANGERESASFRVVAWCGVFCLVLSLKFARPCGHQGEV